MPLPGAEVKLVPAEGAYEIRVRGPMVTPGYLDRPDLTAQAFDDDGFYRSGDAVALADPAEPAAGLVFRGRIAEDFKLATGTFVRVGAVRAALLSAVPVLADVVLAGENRAGVGALAWLNAAEAARLLGAQPEPDGDLISHPALAAHLATALAGHNDAAGSAARVERLLVMARPADLDAGEITDKGYVNQRQVLARRAALVDLLYAEPARAAVDHRGQASLSRASRAGRRGTPPPARRPRRAAGPGRGRRPAAAARRDGMTRSGHAAKASATSREVAPWAPTPGARNSPFMPRRSRAGNSVAGPTTAPTGPSSPGASAALSRPISASSVASTVRPDPSVAAWTWRPSGFVDLVTTSTQLPDSCARLTYPLIAPRPRYGCTVIESAVTGAPGPR